MRRSKIAIIGTGAVGAATAYALLWKNAAAEIILVDADEQRCKGEVLDLSDAIPFCCTSLIRHGSFADAAQADIIVIAAGARQRPEQPRDELLKINTEVVKSIMAKLKPLNPAAIIIMVTNPVDTMAWVAHQNCTLNQKQIFGSGTFLDTQRLLGILARHLHVAEDSIHAYILGHHGDMQFAAWSSAHIAGIPISQFPGITESFLEAAAKETKERVYAIISCKEATYYGIAACVADIIESIVFDKKRIIPISCFHAPYDVYLSMPTVIGADGIGTIFMPPFNADEKKQLDNSIEALQATIEKIK